MLIRKFFQNLALLVPSHNKNQIPIKLLDGEVTAPGYIEADRVSHCGENAEGPFVSNLLMTDLFSGWIENRGIGSKSAEGNLNMVQFGTGESPGE